MEQLNKFLEVIEQYGDTIFRVILCFQIFILTIVCAKRNNNNNNNNKT